MEKLGENTMQSIRQDINQAQSALDDALALIDAGGDARGAVWYLRWVLDDIGRDLNRAMAFLRECREDGDDQG